MKYLNLITIFIVMLFLSACDKVTVLQPVYHSEKNSVAVAVPVQMEYDKNILEEQIAEITKHRKENWSVYVEVPGQGFCLDVNSREVVAASEIKLFNMATFYNELKKGNVEMTDKLKSSMLKMITISSNTDSNEIVKAIGEGDFFKGAKIVTEFSQGIGCTDTKEEHMLFDVAGAATGRNTTSVKDCARILKKIYFRDCVSPEFDEQMLELLKNQTRDWKIPAGIPEGITVANKTGENSKVEFDAAIVFSPSCDYIISICATELKGIEVYSVFAEISDTVYKFLNSDDEKFRDTNN